MNDVLSRYDQLTVPSSSDASSFRIRVLHRLTQNALQEEFKEKQIECEETTMALMNLQTVLEQFQSQKEAEVINRHHHRHRRHGPN